MVATRHGSNTLRKFQLNYNYLSNLSITITTITMKKRSEETQILHAGCSKAQPKIFAPPQTPFPWVRDGQNLISWRWSLPLSINPVW